MANKTIASAIGFKIKATTLTSNCRFFPVPYFCDHDSIKWKTLTFGDSITYSEEDMKNPVIQGIVSMAMHNKGRVAKITVRGATETVDPKPVTDDIPEAPITEISDNTADSGTAVTPGTPDESQPEISEAGSQTVIIETPSETTDADMADGDTSE